MRLYVPVTQETKQALIDLARRERRLLKDQAAILLADAVRRKRPEVVSGHGRPNAER